MRRFTFVPQVLSGLCATASWGLARHFPAKPDRDFAAAIRMAAGPMGLVFDNDLAVKNLHERIAVQGRDAAFFASTEVF